MINKGSRNRVENGRNCTIAINLAAAAAAVERNFSGGMNSRACKIKDAGARISRRP